MKITVDYDQCIGCDLCEGVSGGAMGIEFGKNGKAALNPQADLTDSKTLEGIKLAIQACPMQAIKLEED